MILFRASLLSFVFFLAFVFFLLSFFFSFLFCNFFFLVVPILFLFSCIGKFKQIHLSSCRTITKIQAEDFRTCRLPISFHFLLCLHHLPPSVSTPRTNWFFTEPSWRLNAERLQRAESSRCCTHPHFPSCLLTHEELPARKVIILSTKMDHRVVKTFAIIFFLFLLCVSVARVLHRIQFLLSFLRTFVFKTQFSFLFEFQEDVFL